MMGRERLYYHREVASNLALFSMIKIKYMDTPEIYKTLLAFLSDYDPVKFGNRERTMRYVRLLITDEALVNCILMSLPDATPQSNAVIPSVVPLAPKQAVHAKINKFKSSKLAIRPKRTLSQLNPHHMKDGVGPIRSKIGNKFQGPCRKYGMSTSDLNTSSPAVTRPTSVSGTRDSPAIITCKQSSGFQSNQGKIGPKIQVASGNKPVITRRYSQPSLNPVFRPWTQGQMGMDQSQLPERADAALTHGHQSSMTFPYQCGEYRLPVQYSQMPGLQPYFALNNLLQWQQLNMMSQSGDMNSCAWPGFGTAANSESGLDLSVQTSTTETGVENLAMEPQEMQHQKVQENKLKRSSPNSTPMSESDGTIRPIEALQNLVSNIGPVSYSESDVDSLNRKSGTPRTVGKAVENTDKNLPVDTSLSSTTDVDMCSVDLTSNHPTAENSHREGGIRIDIPSRAFPYSQKVNFPDGKFSVLSFKEENKNSVPSSQGTFAQNEPMLAQSKENEGPEHVIQRSYSMSDLLKLKTGGIANSDIGALNSIVTETSKSQNSTTVKIKLNSCKSGKLLGELLRLQQNKGERRHLSTSAIPQDGGKNDPNFPTAKKNLVTQFYLKNGTSLNLQGSLAATKVVAASQNSGALHIFNTGNLGQAFAIQTKPDFEANKISVTDKALLQTIKERLQQNNRRALSDSELLAMKMSVGQEVATSSNVSERSSCMTNSEHLSTCSQAVVSDSSRLRSSSADNSSLSYLLESSQVQETSIEDDDVFTDE